MDELLAGLEADGPVFDAPVFGGTSVLDNSFEIETDFITDHADQSIYPTSQQAQRSADMDYLNLEEQDVTKLISNPDGDTPTTANAKANVMSSSNPATDDIDFGNILGTSNKTSEPDVQIPNSTANAIPTPSPADAARLRLRPVALTLVTEAWRLSSTPAAFIRPVRERFVTSDTIADDSAAPRQSTNADLTDAPSQPVPWQLAPAAEGAILDALLSKVVNSEAPSTRLLRYIRYALVTGVVSQRALISGCLRWVNATENISDRVLFAIARQLAELIPHYRFHVEDGVDVRPEVKDFLAAFTLVTKCAARAPSALAVSFASVISHERVVALVRACARRVPSAWAQLDTALADLESPPPLPFPYAPPSCSAMVEAPQLVELVPRLKRGLCIGATTIESIVAATESLPALPAEPTLSAVLQTVFGVTVHIFGQDVARVLRDLWTKKEENGGDFHLLKGLEQAIKSPQRTAQHEQGDYPQSSRYGFKVKLQACEAIVRFFAERSAAPEISEQWKKMWGGRERLKRIIRDAIPQVKTEISSETSALVIAMAVTSCACLCLGPALRVNDANDGVDVLNSVDASVLESQNEEVEECMGELIGFAVGSLEEAAKAEEIQSWRSFGLWLLFLMSRAGSILRASGCEHARAAKVLRAWGGQPTGTPGSHVSHGSHSHKHSGQSSSGHQQSQGSSSWAMNEGVTTFAGDASLAIIDVSDAYGSDETLKSLCEDLVQ